jgi:hypothetical protein
MEVSALASRSVKGAEGGGAQSCAGEGCWDNPDMPTVLRSGPYRFFFYSGDRGEPPHIHVEREDKEAKFWLSPVRLQRSQGFRRNELNQIQELVKSNAEILLERWKAFFSG